MAKQMNSVDDFLGHKTSTRGGSFFGNWKENGKVDVWMHTKCLPIALWQHGIPRLVVHEKDKDGTPLDKPERVFYGGKANCPEDEDFLKGQYKRDDEGNREDGKEAHHCGVCRFADWVFKEVAAGRLDWTKPLFRFEATDPSKTLVIHTGGFCNMYSGDLDDAQLASLKKAAISPKKAWNENALAKCSYLFRIVDNAHPEKGVQIATETSLLGDKVKDVLADARESLRDEKGNPFLHPFAIQWEYRETESQINKKYHARRIEKHKLTPIIQKLITGPAPDVSNVIAPMDQKTMRAFLERACVLKGVPWDAIFDVKPVEEGADDVPDGDNSDAEAAADDPAHGNEQDASDGDGAEEEEVACDACGKAAPISATECPHCGEKFDVEEAEAAPPPPPPKQIKKRSEMKKAPPAPQASGKPKGQQSDDDIPF